MNDGMLFAGIHTRARMMKDATGVAFMIRPRGATNAEIWRDHALRAARIVPAAIPEMYPMSIRRIVDPVAFHSAAVPISANRRRKTDSGEGRSSSEFTLKARSSHNPIQKAATATTARMISAAFRSDDFFFGGQNIRICAFLWLFFIISKRSRTGDRDRFWVANGGQRPVFDRFSGEMERCGTGDRYRFRNNVFFYALFLFSVKSENFRKNPVISGNIRENSVISGKIRKSPVKA